MWNSKPVVAIFGSSRITESDKEYEEARVLGRLLARAGYVVCTGGYGGSMEAVCRGAAEANGISLGLTLAVFGDRGANPFVTREIKNATLFERLSNFVELSESFVVLGGGVGTLAELFTIWNLKQTAALNARPFILLGPNWPAIIQHLRANTEIRDKDMEFIQMLDTPEQAIDTLNKLLKR